MEHETSWNPSVTKAELHRATVILSERGLKQAAKWAIEQWMGLPEESEVSPVCNGMSSLVESEAFGELSWKEKSPLVFYAKTLMDMGDYGAAASVLSQPNTSKTLVSQYSMPPPLLKLSSMAVYLRSYCLYMAGERQKEEVLAESSVHLFPSAQRDTTSVSNLSAAGGSTAPFVNPYLQQLMTEMRDSYEDKKLDAFGLYVFGIVLRVSAQQSLVIPHDCPAAASVLMESLLVFPYNWSCWLELAECVSASSSGDIEDKIEITLQPTFANHLCYQLFCAHLQTEIHHAYYDAQIIYDTWMDASLLGGSIYVQTQYALVHYYLRNHDNARRILHDLHTSFPYRLEGMDVYSNILYVQQDSVSLSQLAHTMTVVDKYRAETCCIVGNYYAMKSLRAKAIFYFQKALQLDPSFISAWTLMGHEYVEWKQTSHAVECYRKAVKAAPGDYRAWYGLGQTYEFLNMPLFALYYYKRTAQLRPYDARMWCALGTVLAALQRRSDAIRAYERAWQTGDTEGVATQKLAILYQQDNDAEKAAQCYFRHLELRYQVTQPESTIGMYTGSVQSSCKPLPSPVPLEQMLQGLIVESTEAEAILYLAHYHKDNEEYGVATILCTRLLEYAGPEKEEAKALLRELRSRNTYLSSVTSSHAYQNTKRRPTFNGRK